MADRHNPPFSKALYEEIEEDVKKIIEKNSKISVADIELIQAHLRCLEGAFHQYMGQIEGVLERIKTRNQWKEK